MKLKKTFASRLLLLHSDWSIIIIFTYCLIYSHFELYCIERESTKKTVDLPETKKLIIHSRTNKRLMKHLNF